MFYEMEVNGSSDFYHPFPCVMCLWCVCTNIGDTDQATLQLMALSLAVHVHVCVAY